MRVHRTLSDEIDSGNNYYVPEELLFIMCNKSKLIKRIFVNLIKHFKRWLLYFLLSALNKSCPGKAGMVPYLMQALCYLIV